MRIPKTVKIGGYTYKVIIRVIDKHEKAIGRGDNNMLEILIEKNIPNQKQEEVFIHEVLHAIDYVYNSLALKEGEVERLSEGLYQVFKDNKIWK